MSCLERETGNPHYCLRMLDTVHRIWYSSNPEVQPVSITCIIDLTMALCLNDWWSTISWMIICCYFVKTAFFRSVFSDWCKQPCGVQQEAQQTSSLPPSVETVDACLWDMVHRVGKSIARDANEGAQKVAEGKEDELCCTGILCPTFIQPRLSLKKPGPSRAML